MFLKSPQREISPVTLYMQSRDIRAWKWPSFYDSPVQRVIEGFEFWLLKSADELIMIMRPDETDCH